MNTTHQEFPPQVVSSALFWPANPQLLAEVGLDSFSAQSFEYDARKTLTASSVTFGRMNKAAEFQALISRNIKYFMELDDCPHKSARALALAAKLSPNTVSNYLDARKRTVTSKKPLGFPTLDKLARLTKPLNCQLWELLHPDIAQSRRERDLYRRVVDFSDTIPPASPRPPAR